AKQKKKTPKKRPPKGRPLSEAIARKKAAAAAEEAALDEARAAAFAAEEEDQRLAEVEAGLREEGDDSPLAPLQGEVPEDDIDSAVSAAATDDDFEDDEDDEEHEDDEADEEHEDDEDGEWEEDDEDDDEVGAAQMGHRRYVIAGFFALWLVTAYITGKALEMAWSMFATKDWFVRSLPSLAAVPYEGELVSRASMSLVAGAVIAGMVVYRYFVKPDVRQWADEVAEELSHVKWPNRKEVNNHTIVCIASTAILTFYLSVLDRLWSFLSDIIYKFGT
ncbi:MAG: preprotein translocase subunit SecE, partial [Polyangiaceae bacterium]